MTRSTCGHFGTMGEKLSENEANTELGGEKVNQILLILLELLYSATPEAGPPVVFFAQSSLVGFSVIF